MFKVVFLVSIILHVAVSRHNFTGYPEHDRGCLFILGVCAEECPIGTHSYSSGCTTPTKTEKTCEQPESKLTHPLCDYSRCECDEPTVKNEATNRCVRLEECPDYHPGY